MPALQHIEHEDRCARFVDEYLVDFNAVAAYRRAFAWAGPGAILDNEAKRKAAKLLADPIVRQEIDRRRAGRLLLDNVTRERVVLELARIAFMDPAKCFLSDDDERAPFPDEQRDPDKPRRRSGWIKSPEQMDEDTRRALAGYEQGEFGPKLKFADKLSALNTLAKMAGMLVDKHEVKVTHSVSLVDDLDEEEATTLYFDALTGALDDSDADE